MKQREMLITFDEELLEEDAAILQYEANMTRQEADKEITLRYPGCKYKRIFNVTEV